MRVELKPQLGPASLTLRAVVSCGLGMLAHWACATHARATKKLSFDHAIPRVATTFVCKAFPASQSFFLMRGLSKPMGSFLGSGLSFPPAARWIGGKALTAPCMAHLPQSSSARGQCSKTLAHQRPHWYVRGYTQGCRCDHIGPVFCVHCCTAAPHTATIPTHDLERRTAIKAPPSRKKAALRDGDPR